MHRRDGPPTCRVVIYNAMKSVILSNTPMNVYRTFERATAKRDRQFVSDTIWQLWHFHGGIPRLIIERRRHILTSEIRSLPIVFAENSNTFNFA